MFQQPPAAFPAMAGALLGPPAEEEDMTSRIVAALKGHVGGGSGGLGALSQPPPPPEPAAPTDGGLGAALLSSLVGLQETAGDAFAGSGDGQELFRMVQSAAAPAPPVRAFALDEPVERVISSSSRAAPSEGSGRPDIDHDRVRPQLRPPDRLPEPGDDDVSSDEGVPHRLPPGFGAIPEDIVEERARLREEQRVLQIKATQPCRFGKRCKRRDCPNLHPEGRDIDTSLNPCAFGTRCKRKGCFYDHPEGRLIDLDPTKGMCKFGARCTRPDCLYDHPPERAPVAGADSRICFFCHGSGHIAGDCPANPESWNYKPQALPAPPAST